VADADPMVTEPAGMVGDGELDRRLGYHPATAETIPLYEGNRAAAVAYARHLDRTCPPGRELALALTAVQESLMWANAAVACELAPLENPAGRQPNPLVQQMAHDAQLNTLQITVQVPADADPVEAGKFAAAEITAQMRLRGDRSAAEQSLTAPRQVQDRPQA